MPEVYHCNEPEVLVEGPAGTGKTLTDHLRIISLCELAPGSRHLYTRQVRADMGETVLKSLEAALGDSHPMVLGGASREHRKAYEFANGSQIVVAGLDRPERTYSGEYDTVTLFEAMDVPYDSYQRLLRTLRGKSALPFKQIRVECNPDAPTHWINTYFANRPGMRRFKTTHKDNPYLWDEARGDWTQEGRAYMDKLGRMTGHQRARLLYGEWVGADGLIFDEWDPRVHLVKRREMPAGWEDWWRIESFDFGYEEPFVYQLWAVDPDGRMYLEREYVAARKTVNRHAEEVNRIRDPYESRGLIQFSVADHDREDRATLEEHGISTQSADKPTTGNWTSHLESVKRRMCRDADGYPRLFVLDDALVRKCPVLEGQGKPCGFAEEVRGYVWKAPGEGQPSKERPHQVNDHSMDCARYAVRAVDQWYSGDIEKPKAKYEYGSLGWAIGLDDEEE